MIEFIVSVGVAFDTGKVGVVIIIDFEIFGYHVLPGTEGSLKIFFHKHLRQLLKDAIQIVPCCVSPYPLCSVLNVCHWHTAFHNSASHSHTIVSKDRKKCNVHNNLTNRNFRPETV